MEKNSWTESWGKCVSFLWPPPSSGSPLQGRVEQKDQLIFFFTQHHPYLRSASVLFTPTTPPPHTHTGRGAEGGRNMQLIAGLPLLGMVIKSLGDINCHQALGT